MSVVHGDQDDRAAGCEGQTRSYRYRCYDPSDERFERCIGVVWCPACREYAGAMVHVPRREHLTDLLADLPVAERERLLRSEVKLVGHLDRLGRADQPNRDRLT